MNDFVMNNQENTELFEAWKFFVTLKWILKVIAGIILVSVALFFTCNTASGQERAVLVASSKIKASTKFLVCVELKDGRRYSFKYDVHCWNCKVVNIPTYWNVVTKRRRTFIQPEL